LWRRGRSSSFGETRYIGCADDNSCPCESHALFGEDEAEAREAWNRRDGEAARIAQAVAAENKRTLDMSIDVLHMGLSGARRELEEALRRSVEPTIHAKLRGRVEAWESAIKHIGGKVEEP
jgi:hypothetical protein